ncbi:lipopolysaccharide biosynthesis protein [Ferruginibacter sp. SUN106]|uniref:lipopolysaccharide biosynthesis protein n=1 Tax=Ferruginibacter sp. SUN106 TaxID=2978348 RepID=UPI003D35D9E3
MSNIRRQSIFSSLLIYMGFAFGALNTYFFTKQGLFKPEEYGLIQAIININLVFFSICTLGAPAMMSRFFPYYDELPKKENDLFTFVLFSSFAGFIILCLLACFFQPLVVRKFQATSSLLIHYYYWILPYTFFYTIYYILEVQSYISKKAVAPSFLRETVHRLIVTFLIVLFVFKVINFDEMVKSYAFSYALLMFFLAAFLIKHGLLNFTFKISSVTKKHYKEILKMMLFVYTGGIIFYLGLNFDSINLTRQGGLEKSGIFTLSMYIASIISVPQRSIVAITSPHIATAWKEKNLKEISRIYSRSSINLLIISLFIFLNIWLNIDDAYIFLKINPTFIAGKYVIFILGLKFIIDMGTGVNAQMLHTSNFWKFEFITGVVLLFLTIPLNYWLTQKYDMVGAGIAGFISLTVYNIIRLWFIYYKFKMQPFTINSLKSVIVAAAIYGLVYFVSQTLSGLPAMIIRSTLFSLLFMVTVYFLKLTPDMEPVVNSIKKRLGIKTTQA